MVAALRKEISGLRQQLRLAIAGAPKLELQPQERWGDSAAAPDSAAAAAGPAATRRIGGWHLGADSSSEDEGSSVEEEEEEEEGAEPAASAEEVASAAAAAGAGPVQRRGRIADRNKGISQGRQSSILDTINADDSSGAALMPPGGSRAGKGSASRVSRALRLVEERLAARGAAAPNITAGSSAADAGGPLSSTKTAAALGISAAALEAAWAVPADAGAAGAAVQAATAGPAGARQRAAGPGEEEGAEGVLPTSAEALQLEALQIENAQLRWAGTPGAAAAAAAGALFAHLLALAVSGHLHS